MIDANYKRILSGKKKLICQLILLKHQAIKIMYKSNVMWQKLFVKISAG